MHVAAATVLGVALLLRLVVSAANARLQSRLFKSQAVKVVCFYQHLVAVVVKTNKNALRGCF
jgi:hypothetical protein